MPFPWSGKRDPAEPDGPELFEPPDKATPADKTPGDLETLAGGLDSLGKLLGRVNQQIAAYLVRRETEATAGSAPGGSAALAKKIDALAQKLDRLTPSGSAVGPPGETPPALPGKPAALAPAGTVEEILQRLDKKIDTLGQSITSGGPAPGSATAEAIRSLQRQLEDGLKELADHLAPPKKAAGAPGTSADWERAILGPGLAENSALDFQRQQLVRGVLDADRAACTLAGQLLVFQSAAAERMPQLLKDTGEAYYRWQPKTRPGANPMEQALVAWLAAVCEKAGIGNTIELVHPGERFDSTRHTATTRGVEITEVHGWIVLRDNGKVYTKANVAAQ